MPKISKSAAARREALEKLLQPIKWHWSSSIESRRDLVVEKQYRVKLVLPFLTTSEKRRAAEWLKAEAHEGLWD